MVRKLIMDPGGATLVTLCILLGCSPQSGRTPAMPVTMDDGPGTLPKWADPGDPTCAFPKEADPAKIDAADVTVRVLVRADGSPQMVQTIEEPGFGFGPAATRCAMARRYKPATSDRGVPISGWTPPIRIRFVR